MSENEKQLPDEIYGIPIETWYSLSEKQRTGIVTIAVLGNPLLLLENGLLEILAKGNFTKPEFTMYTNIPEEQ
ncbi:hypothetical protein COT75_00555 [Candidatus Beckwithbacteria bacterium CG10_big_fil_rev_8_21_14_0_10_34_10]|uniref:Uncharacterized protein n=1 Tax=Candidatus Beckwithbacteria bacterium CG10_big_fil_rev_8_21_14_0_10_34_10 TaxID=1974495 RepID=A0A2H0WAI9_9BACT|nr:MAG: hypothetical protein COT75_00555 [Candidatus Beckwithbacteria bacterium CG10_big_fil_rev_8_21_14_0_10_34_10]